MCGICGFVGEGRRQDLELMVSSLSHRGPDDRGVDWVEGVGLGHTRLSILDLSASGHQPMYDANHKVGVVFNGEIYNYLELKQELEARGYTFSSTSDTEVIIYLYQEYGDNCFEKLSGMFAIAIYDFLQQKTILARDRLGKKPLYYAVLGGNLIFGSELKSLLAHPMIKRELDLESISLYLFYEYVPTPRTIFKNIFKLEPATILDFQSGQVSKKNFWRPPAEKSRLSFGEAINILDEKINQATASRLVSDVPLGVFLSGGLDSSAVAYYAQRNSSQPIKTFSIGFDESSFDESAYARQVSNFLGTEHYHQSLTATDSLKLIPRIAELLDEPMADASIVPTYLLSLFTKGKVTVALGGDGGDELFAGYPTFQAEKLAAWYLLLPSVLRKKIIEPLVNLLPAGETNFSLGFKLRKFVAGTNPDQIRRHQEWLSAFSREERSKLFKPEVWEKVEGLDDYEHLAPYLAEVETSEPGNRLLYSYMRSYLLDGVMVKVDRASMMASLETRSPLLDYQVVEFAQTLPYRYKLWGFKTKYIFKKMMSGKLPASIIWRAKKGFGVPLTRWLRYELRDWCDRVLSQEKIDQYNLFNYDYVNQIKQEHFSGEADHRKKLWTLLVFCLWAEKWGK